MPGNNIFAGWSRLGTAIPFTLWGMGIKISLVWQSLHQIVSSNIFWYPFLIYKSIDKELRKLNRQHQIFKFPIIHWNTFLLYLYIHSLHIPIDSRHPEAKWIMSIAEELYNRGQQKLDDLISNDRFKSFIKRMPLYHRLTEEDVVHMRESETDARRDMLINDHLTPTWVFLTGLSTLHWGIRQSVASCNHQILRQEFWLIDSIIWNCCDIWSHTLMLYFTSPICKYMYLQSVLLTSLCSPIADCMTHIALYIYQSVICIMSVSHQYAWWLK